VAESYLQDLAYIHHAGFGDFAVEAAPGVVSMLRAHAIEAGVVVELGCGSGLLARELARAGYDVVGIDASAAMLDIAAATAPSARLFRCSLHEADIPRCDAVVSLGECIGYLPQHDACVDLHSLFERVAAALRPGGLFVFDLVRATDAEPMSYRTWRAGPDWAVLIEVEEDAQNRRLRRGIVAFRAVGGAWRRSQETHWLQLFTREEVAAALRAAGFSARELAGYGSRSLAPQRVAFAAIRGGA